MIRAFRPSDVLRLRRRQTRGASLDHEGRVLCGRSPLQHALASLWPGRRSPYRTWLIEPEDGSFPGGFAQARLRRAGQEADLVFVAPDLHAGPRAVTSWQRLLPEVCQQLAALGVARIFARIDQADVLARQVLRQLGFAAHAQDTIYAWAELTPRSPSTLVRCVAPASQHRHDLDRLARRTLPQVDARAPGGGEWGRHPLGGHFRGRRRSRVWLDGHGAVRGAWLLCEGPGGRWLSCLVEPGAEAEPLLLDALSAADGDDRPLLCAARSDQVALHAALRRQGLQPVAERLHLIKHSTARVLEPAWQERQVRERGLEAAATRFSPPAPALRGGAEPPGAIQP